MKFPVVFSAVAAVALGAVSTGMPALAQDYSAGAINNPSPGSLIVYGARSSRVDAAEVPGGRAIKVEVQKGANPWDAGVLSRVNAPVNAGEQLVFAFWARLASGEDGAASVTLPWNSVSLASAPWTRVFGAPVTIGPEWKLYEVSGRADRDYAAGALQAGVQVANASQTVEFGPMYVAKKAGGSPAAAAAPAAGAASRPSTLAATDLASKIVNDPSVSGIRGAKSKLFDDSNVQGGKAVRVAVAKKGANNWDSVVESSIGKPVKAGDRLVLAFEARLEQGPDGAASATIPYAAIQLGSAPYTTVAQRQVTVGPEWTFHKIEGTADKDYPPGTLKATIHIGNARQTIDFGPIVVFNLGQ